MAELKLTHGDATIDVKGMSMRETDALVERFLDEANQRQREVDERWKQLRKAEEGERPANH